MKPEKISLTLTDCQFLPNMLAILARANLLEYGKYSCTIDGEKILFVLKGSVQA